MGRYYFKSEKVGIKLSGMGQQSIVHRKVMQDLVRYIYENISTVINYDHVRMTVPKSPVPLKYRNKRTDIAFFVSDTVVRLQIDTLKPLKPLRNLLRDHAKGKGSHNTDSG